MQNHHAIGKVTCFITRKNQNNTELLLIRHPHAGIQLPAGTVEWGEDFQQAALREAFEETGLHQFVSCNYIGKQELPLPKDQYVILQNAKIYSRPTSSSFQWAEIRRGIKVQHERKHEEFVQISYIEEDQFPEPNYITYQITGWVNEEHLASVVERHFYHMHTISNEENEWEQEADGHTFTLFWCPLGSLPEIVPSQNEWLEYVCGELKYTF